MLLSTWLIVSIPFVQPSYPDTLVFPLVSLMVAASTAAFGSAYRRQGMLASACLILSISWIVASIGTAILQVVQLFGPDRAEFWLLPRKPHLQPYGNLGQRNHAACVHALALLSAAHLLWSRQKPFRWVLALSVVMALAGLVMSGSRIGSILGGIGACAFVILAVDLRRSDGRLDMGRIVRRGLLVALAYPVIYLLGAQLVAFTDAAQAFDGAIARWTTYGNTPRIVLQELAIKIFLEHPFMGAGWGSFTAQSLNKADELLLPQYANNSHNLLTQLAAETGIVGLIVVVVPMAIVLVRALRAHFQPEQGYLLLLCAVFLVYSMTEFPLWHTFFLLPFMFALGLLDTSAVEVRFSKAMRISAVAFYVSVCIAAGYAVDRYIGIARMTSLVFKPGRLSDEWRSYVFSNLNAPGFSPQTELLAFGLLNVDKNAIEQKIALGRRVVRQHIVQTVLTRQAGLLALNGQTDEAVAHLIAACRFYPEQCHNTENELATLAKLDPASFLPVLEEFQRRRPANTPSRE